MGTLPIDMTFMEAWSRSCQTLRPDATPQHLSKYMIQDGGLDEVCEATVL
jgi:hypothetical protein